MDEVTWGPAEDLEASGQPEDEYEVDLGDALPPDGGNGTN